MHAPGRRPELGSLDLSTGQVAVQDGRLQLDAHLRRISNPRVYAAGDAAGLGTPLTQLSSHDAKTVAANLLQVPSRAPDNYVHPSSAFTLPPTAAARLSRAPPPPTRPQT